MTRLSPAIFGEDKFQFADGLPMNSQKYRHPRKKRVERPAKSSDYKELVHPESTGTESSYFKSLIDSHKKVTVMMKNGEQFHGRIRYYDRYCFSIGLSSEKRKILLRKESVSYILEK